MMNYEAGSLDLGQTSLKYYTANPRADGTPIVFLHPWFGCWQFWHRTVDALPGTRSHLLDLYSLGDGDWRSFSGPEGLARAVLAFMNAHGICKSTLVGNSMGGIAAQALAASAPDRVEKVVLVGTGASTDRIKPDYMVRLRKWVAQTSTNGESDRLAATALVDSLLARRPESAQSWKTFVDAIIAANRIFMADMLEQAFELDLRPRLGSIAAETLIVRGERDNARTLQHVQDLLDGIADSSYAEIPGGGHSPMVDSPSQFIPVVKTFLDK